MTKEDNIRAVLETHFTGFREDIIESAVKMIMDVTEEWHGSRLCEIPYWQIEQIAGVVVRKLKENEGVSIFKPIGGRGGE